MLQDYFILMKTAWSKVMIPALRILPAVLWLALPPVAAGAAEYGDAAAGLGLAQQWCATCHVVAQDQTVASQIQAPSFSLVAAGLNEARRGELTAWLSAPHGQMQAISLSRQQIADVLAYIATLKRP